MTAGVYLHIPFCKSRCSYCDFATDVYRSSDAVDRYVAALEKEITEFALQGIAIDTVCAPALGGLIAGFALATALDKRSIFAERVNGEMQIRRGFEITPGEKVLICEDIITTGGSAMEAAKAIEALGGEVVGFAALANRGFCKRSGSPLERKPNCSLPENKPLFALADFDFEMYAPENCPLCADGSEAIKPGSRGN